MPQAILLIMATPTVKARRNTQEKYLRELSITPVGYFTGAIKNHSRAVSHRNYFAWRKCGISEEQE
jgi:hypothetical protein